MNSRKEIVYRVNYDLQDSFLEHLAHVNKLIKQTNNGVPDFEVKQGEIVIFRQYDNILKKYYASYGLSLSLSNEFKTYALICPLIMIGPGQINHYGINIGKIEELHARNSFIGIIEKIGPIDKADILNEKVDEHFKTVVVDNNLVNRVLVNYRDYLEKLAESKICVKEAVVC